MTDLFQKLAAPFSPDIVSWRVGSTNKDKTSALALAYIDARDVMARLDEVVGPANWQRRYPWSDTKRLCCEIGIKIDGEWLWKGDGAGDTDVEAEKGAFSDAFKRAAVSWGIGRYLYDLDSPWVQIEPFGRSYKIKDSERAKLTAVLRKGAPAVRQPPQREPETVREVLDSLPPPSHAKDTSWAEFVADFCNEMKAASDADRPVIWNRESENIAAYKKHNPEGYKAVFDWIKALGKQKAAA